MLVERYEADGFATLRGFADAGGRAGDARRRRRDRAGPARRRAGGARAGAARGAAGLRRRARRTPRTSCRRSSACTGGPAFASFLRSPDLLPVIEALLGPGDVDCFLSQFIFKNPGAWGQPWHQDSYYFPFEPPRRIVGLWLAVTEATLENGCLHVLPGSHREPVHEHVPDRRPGANYGYTEIVDHDPTGQQPSLMEPGDLLVFDSHLMHRSTDNRSAGIRAAMVFHVAAAGTVDRTDRGPRLREPGQRLGPPDPRRPVRLTHLTVWRAISARRDSAS